jgi:hypothetical protein
VRSPDSDRLLSEWLEIGICMDFCKFGAKTSKETDKSAGNCIHRRYTETAKSGLNWESDNNVVFLQEHYNIVVCWIVHPDASRPTPAAIQAVAANFVIDDALRGLKKAGSLGAVAASGLESVLNEAGFVRCNSFRER